MNKLENKQLEISPLTKDEQNQLKGGFVSVGSNPNGTKHN